jgi:hypothetical protein
MIFIRPREVFVPVITAGMKKPHPFTRNRVVGGYGNQLEVIAARTGEGKIADVVRTFARERNNVFDHEWIRRERGQTAAVFTGVLRSFPDQPFDLD